MYRCYMYAPCGPLEIVCEEDAIIKISFCEKAQTSDAHPLLEECVLQLQEYFAGKRSVFHIPYRFIQGTVFQKRCWDALCQIPYGETWSYQKQAEFIQHPKAMRAVGAANHHNPIAIIVPCHRVIGKQGQLVGYAAGLDKKRYLLELEKKYADIQVT